MTLEPSIELREAPAHALKILGSTLPAACVPHGAWMAKKGFEVWSYDRGSEVMWVKQILNYLYTTFLWWSGGSYDQLSMFKPFFKDVSPVNQKKHGNFTNFTSKRPVTHPITQDWRMLFPRNWWLKAPTRNPAPTAARWSARRRRWLLSRNWPLGMRLELRWWLPTTACWQQWHQFWDKNV